MKKRAIIKVYNQDKKIEEIEVLKYFTLKQDNNDYIIYRPVKSNMNNESFIFSAMLKENENTIFLMPIENKEIEELIKSIVEKIINGVPKYEYW